MNNALEIAKKALNNMPSYNGRNYEHILEALKEIEAAEKEAVEHVRKAFEYWHTDGKPQQLEKSRDGEGYDFYAADWRWDAFKAGAAFLQKPVVPDRKKPQSNNDGYYIAAFHHPFEPAGYNWWRPNYAGYTPLISQAGIYTHEDAMRLTSGDSLQVAVPVAFSRELKLQEISNESEKIHKIFSGQTNLQAAIAHFLGNSQGEQE